MRYFFWVWFVVLGVVATVAFGGDSSGGGSSRVLQFKRAVGIYVHALEQSKISQLHKFGIEVNARTLAKALYGPTRVRPLAFPENFVIDEARQVVVKHGKIFEADLPLTCYYQAEKATIYVGLDWTPEQSEVALKEYVRVLELAEPETQTLNLVHWYQTAYPNRQKIAADDFPFVYEARLAQYTKEYCEESLTNFIPLMDRNAGLIPTFTPSSGYGKEDLERDRLAAEKAGFSGIPLLETPKLAEPWDFAWEPDLAKRAKLVKLHQEVWELTQSAKEQVDSAAVEAIVHRLAKMLTVEGVEDLATQAMGEIRHPAAAQYLFPLLESDLSAADLDPELQKSHKKHFWAPLVLGNLDYSRHPKLLLKAEAAIFALLEADEKSHYSVSATALNGACLIGGTRTRDYLRARLLNGKDYWNTARGIATLHTRDEDYRFVLPLYEAALQVSDERDFRSLVGVLAMYRDEISRRGYNQSLIFSDLLRKAVSLGYINGDTRLALVRLMPAKCEDARRKPLSE